MKIPIQKLKKYIKVSQQNINKRKQINTINIQ